MYLSLTSHFDRLAVSQLKHISSTSRMPNSVKGHNRANFIFYKITIKSRLTSFKKVPILTATFFSALLRQTVNTAPAITQVLIYAYGIKKVPAFFPKKYQLINFFFKSIHTSDF